MKVSSSKPESQSQPSANTELTSPSDVPADFFSELIANLLSASAPQNTDEQEPESSDLPQDETAPQSAAEEQPALLLNFWEQPRSLPEATTNNSVPKTDLDNKIREQQIKTIPQYVMENFREQISTANNINDLQKNIHNEINRISIQAQEYSIQNDEVLPESMNEKNEKNVKLTDNFMQKQSISSDQNRSSVLNFNVSQEQSEPRQNFTVYNMQDGKLNYPEENKSKYVDALAQMSSMINSHTANFNQQSMNVQATAQADYTNVLKNINRPEYELNIELLPQTLDFNGKETYNANIKIHPPELGAVIAKLKVDKNNAELFITAENYHVKAIVEANLMQLRENFQKHDINLSHIHVDVQNPQTGTSAQDEKQQKPQESGERNETGADKRAEVKQQEARKRIDSLVDTYA